MKTTRLLFSTGIFCLIFAVNTFGFQISNIKITFDSESARATLNAFKEKKISDDELARIVKLPGNQGLIKQSSRFDKQATEENFKTSLKQIVETGTVETDTFSFPRVKERLAATQVLLDQIEKNNQTLANEIIDRIRQYTPPGTPIDVKIYFIAGGTSDGFAPDRKTFYVALHYFEDDYEGLKLLMAHELYHNAQSSAISGRKFLKDGAAVNITNSFSLLQSTLQEGTASVVGDPLEITNGKKYISWFQGKFKNNLRRIDTNFALFDTLLYRLYNDAEADTGKLYNIGFSGTFDSALYFVGYRMARVIEKHKGKQAIASAISENPLQFFNQYIELYKKQGDSEAIPFSKSTEEILQKLASQTN